MKKILLNIDKKCGIYRIYNIKTGKSYVGSSKNIYTRLLKHRAMLRKGYHNNKRLQNDWLLYGENQFDYEIIELCNQCDLRKREQYYVDNINSDYNLIKQVERNILSKESRLMQSKTRKRLFEEGKLTPARMKKVYKYDLDGNFLESYVSLYDASRKNNIHVSSIIRNLNGTYKQACGFQWSYKKYNKLGKVLTERKDLMVPIFLKDIITGIVMKFDSIADCSKEIGLCPYTIHTSFTKGIVVKKRYMIKLASAVLQSNLEEDKAWISSEAKHRKMHANLKRRRANDSAQETKYRLSTDKVDEDIVQTTNDI